MAIAGGAIHSIDLQISNGKLVEGKLMHRNGQIVESSVDDVITRLKIEPEGTIVYLKLEGFDLIKVRNEFQ